MSIDVADAVADAVAIWSTMRPIEVIWHGGEPLSAGRGRLSSLMDRFSSSNVRHGVQTNATLIDDEWCELFKSYNVRISISIDGPGSANSQRVNFAGRPSLDLVLRGAATLKKHDIPFNVLAVVSDPSPRRAHDLYPFLIEIGARSAGVNIEAQQGVNRRDAGHPTGEVAAFWAELAAAWRERPVIQLRELQSVLAFASLTLEGDSETYVPTKFDPFPTVTWNGDVSLLSPELAGFSDERLGGFACGNVLDAPMVDLVATGLGASWVDEYLQGVSMCRQRCSYFSFCGGGSAASRYFEHGRLNVTKTNHCQNAKISLFEGVIGNAGED